MRDRSFVPHCFYCSVSLISNNTVNNNILHFPISLINDFEAISHLTLNPSPCSSFYSDFIHIYVNNFTRTCLAHNNLKLRNKLKKFLILPTYSRYFRIGIRYYVGIYTWSSNATYRKFYWNITVKAI